MSLPLSLPESRNEQISLLAALKSETISVDKAIERERSQITLIQEYRDSLIAAVVTGQLDVRNAKLAAVAGPAPAPDVDEMDADMEDELEPAD